MRRGGKRRNGGKRQKQDTNASVAIVGENREDDYGDVDLDGLEVNQVVGRAPGGPLPDGPKAERQVREDRGGAPSGVAQEQRVQEQRAEEAGAEAGAQEQRDQEQRDQEAGAGPSGVAREQRDQEAEAGPSGVAQEQRADVEVEVAFRFQDGTGIVYMMPASYKTPLWRVACKLLHEKQKNPIFYRMLYGSERVPEDKTIGQFVAEENDREFLFDLVGEQTGGGRS